jgi:hypothetical protein
MHFPRPLRRTLLLPPPRTPLHSTFFVHYLFLSISTFLLGFIAHRLPLHLFEDPESATPGQILALHFGLAFNFVADVEWIRLGVLPNDDTFLYPELINAPFEHSFRKWSDSNPPPLPPLQDMKRFLKEYLMCYRWSLCFYAFNYCVNRMICYALGTGKDAYNTMWGFDVLYNSGGYFVSGSVAFLLLRPVRLGNAFVFSGIAGWMEKRGENMKEKRDEEESKHEVWVEHNTSVFA